MPLTTASCVLPACADDRVRPLLGMWVAAPAVAAFAYTTCFVSLGE